MELRLTELCSKLGISDTLKHHIWTCFEYALVKRTRIMVNRNLEHLLLCAIYNTAKVGFNGLERSLGTSQFVIYIVWKCVHFEN